MRYVPRGGATILVTAPSLPGIRTVHLAIVALALVVCAVLPAGAAAEPQGVGFSPDGRSLYVSSYSSTLAFARDPASGSLRKVGAYPGASGSAIVSPDGRFVYVGGAIFTPGTGVGPPIVAYRRDAGDGALTPLAPVAYAGRRGETGQIALSADGLELYAIDSGLTDGSGLLVFARDSATGALLFKRRMFGGDDSVGGVVVAPDGQVLVDGGEEVKVLEQTDQGLAPVGAQSCLCGGRTTVISPEGDRLYIGPYGPKALARDPATGTLSELPDERPLIDSGYGYESSGASMATAPGGSLYIPQYRHNRFHHAQATDTGLALVHTWRNFDGGAQGIDNSSAVGVSPDVRHVYVVGSQIAIFSRNGSSGTLTFAGLWKEPEAHPRIDVSVNGGATYTRDRDVTVSVREDGVGHPGPVFYIANDGGFGDAQQIPYAAPSVPWRLATTGPEALPKTVYARSITGALAYDDIVLDERLPQVVAARRRGRRGTRLALRVKDRISGVAGVQIARRRKRPGAWKRLSQKPYAVSRRTVYVRVRDRAGNRSRWRKVTARRKR